MPADDRFQAFLERHLALIQPLSRDVALANWENSLTGTEESADRLADLTGRLRKVYASPVEYAELKQIADGGLSDPLLMRQSDILLRAFLSEQMPSETIDRIVRLEADLELEFSNYRAEFRGRPHTDNEVHHILRDSDDAALRREAWMASKTLGFQVAERVLELVNLRNGAARALGYRDYYAMAFALDELDESRVFNTFDELIALSDPHWTAWKSEFDAKQAVRFGITADELRPWHHTDLFFQETPPGDVNLDRYFTDKDIVEITRRYFSAIGLPIEPIVLRSDLFERPGKNQHAFCTDIDREGDVRVLCNVAQDERWMGTMLHEYGHAVYDFYSDPALPWILRSPAHTLSTEAIAEMMGRFSKDPNWLKLYADIPADELSSVAMSTKQEKRVQFLMSTRWIVTMCRFEQSMYRDPDQNLNALWWDLVERYQGVRRPDDRDAPDWASKLHLCLAPCYYQNYLLGELVAAQLLNYLRTNVVPGIQAEALHTSPDVGGWLHEAVFRQGAKRHWEDALEFATGERLNAGYFAGQFVS